MNLPRDLLERPVPEAARFIALGYLKEARASADRLIRGEGGEDLHDFRVAIRRLRSLLRAWRGPLQDSIKKKHRTSLRDVHASTGGGRDYEVAAAWIQGQLGDATPEEHAGKAWAAADLEARHAAEMEDVRGGALAAFRAHAKKLRKRLRRPVETSAVPGPTFAAALVEAVRRHMDDVVLELARVQSVEDVREAHDARIRVKRLRYLVEPLEGILPEAAGFTQRCKRLQTVLGDLHDARVLETQLETAVPAENAAEMEAGLAGLRRETRARQAELFDELQRGWLVNRAADLREPANRLILACARAGTAPTEIERKYLLRALPSELPAAATSLIHQGWVPGEQPRLRLRLRIRDGGETQRVRTLKGGRGLERIELEDEISEPLFDLLWPLTEGARVYKRRHVVTVGHRAWELDEFLDREGLFFAEIELASVSEPVEVPVWLAPCIEREVTEESGFSNQELAQ